MKESNSNSVLMKTVLTGLFTAISLVLFLLEFPIIPGNTALKLDFSDIPALVGAICLGPVFGVTIELLKNIFEMIFKGLGTQMGFGNLMNFIVGCAFIIPFSLVFRCLSKKKAFGEIKANIIAGIISTGSIVATGVVANYFVSPAFFMYFLHVDISKDVLWGFIGSASILNLVKGIILSVCAYPISKVLNKQLESIHFK